MEGIQLRPWQISDCESLVENANDIEVARYLTNKFPHPYTLAHAREFIQFANSAMPVHIFAIVLHNTAIGGIGIHPQDDVMKKNAEIGFWLGRAYWGKGIMSGVIPHILAFAFENYDITRVYARVFGNNIASQRVVEKAGFTKEAVLSKTIYKNDAFLDEIIYGYRKSLKELPDDKVVRL